MAGGALRIAGRDMDSGLRGAAHAVQNVWCCLTITKIPRRYDRSRNSFDLLTSHLNDQRHFSSERGGTNCDRIDIWDELLIVVVSLAIFLAPFIALLCAPRGRPGNHDCRTHGHRRISYVTRCKLRATPPTRWSLLVGINLVLALACFLVLIALIARG